MPSSSTQILVPSFNRQLGNGIAHGSCLGQVETLNLVIFCLKRFISTIVITHTPKIQMMEIQNQGQE